MSVTNPAAAAGETVYGKLRRLARTAQLANPHLLDSTTGLPAVLPSAKAPALDTTQSTYTNNAAIVAAGFSQPILAASAGVVNPKFTYTGGWPIVYANSYVRLPCVTNYPTGAGNAGSNPSIAAYTGKVHFWTDSPKFVVGAANAMVARIIVDGQYVSLTPTTWPATTLSAVVVDFSSVGGRARRHIVIEFNGVANFAGLWFGPTDTYEPVTFSDSLSAAYFGDSIDVGTGATYCGDAFTGVSADALGIQNYRQIGIGSTGPGVSTASGYAAEQHVFDIIAQNPDMVFITHNVNSQANGWAATQAAWLSMYGQIRAFSASIPIFQIGVLISASAGDANNATALAYETAQAAFVKSLALSDPNLFYVPIMTDPLSPWITGTGYVGNLKNDGNRDIMYSQAGPHPNDTGHRYVGTRFARGVLAAIAGKA